MSACITSNLERIQSKNVGVIDPFAIGQQAVGQFAQQPVSQNLRHVLNHTLPEALRGKLPSIAAIGQALGAAP